jgi:hypothetical protein
MAARSSGCSKRISMGQIDASCIFDTWQFTSGLQAGTRKRD